MNLLHKIQQKAILPPKNADFFNQNMALTDWGTIASR